MSSECDEAMRRMDIEAADVEQGYFHRNNVKELIENAQGRVHHINVEAVINGGTCDDTCLNGGAYRPIDDFVTLTDELKAGIEGR